MRSRRGRKVAGVALAACFSLTTFVATASASGLLRLPAGTPDPKLMVLKSSDLAGAKVDSQRYYRDPDFPSVISYERSFNSGRTGGKRFLSLGTTAEIGVSAQSTAGFLTFVRRVLGSKRGRADFEKSFADEIGPDDVVISDLRVGRPRNLGVGPGSFDLLVTVKILELRTELHFAVFRVERVLGALLMVGAPGTRVPLSAITRLARLMAHRMAEQLAPKNVVLPVISGTSLAGEMLTSNTGSWAGEPTSFGYQWLRCDTAGANCTAIGAATGPDYLLTAAEVGSTIRVSVGASNSYGAATARSAPTAVVLPTQAPANTSLPTITGLARVGQTLTGTTGSWAGGPTTFSFQWQRCDPDGANCGEIPGASSGTYVLGGTDVGATIRVAVTAANGFGGTTAVSPPTAVVF